MSRIVKIASVQLPALPRGETNHQKKADNYRAAEEMVTKAGEQGAEIAAIGEMFNVHGCDLQRETFCDLIEGEAERTIKRMGSIAKNYAMNIIAPVYAMIDGVPANAALLLGKDGQLIGQYIKVHCTEDERQLGVVPGNEWPVFQLDFGRIGIMICHDNSFPESARCLTVNGAEVIFWPHVMGGWGDVFMDVLLRAPAIHNGIHFVPVCYGYEPDVAWQTGQMMIGRSSIIGPDATIIADAGRYKGIAYAVIDLDLPRVAQMWTRTGEYVYRLDMLTDRRPDTYACLLRPVPPVDPLKGEELGSFPLCVEKVNRFIDSQDPS